MLQALLRLHAAPRPIVRYALPHCSSLPAIGRSLHHAHDVPIDTLIC